MAMEIAALGIDLGKNSCSLVALDQAGAIIKRRRMRPESIPGFTKAMSACVVAIGGLLRRASPRPAAGPPRGARCA